MYAIVRQSGKQYRISVGDELVCDRIKGKVGAPVVFDKLLLISDGGNNIVGSGDLAKYQIEAELVENFIDDKINVFKYKAKKGYRKLTGHRQQKSRIRIDSIGKAGKKKVASTVKKENEAAPVEEQKKVAPKSRVSKKKEATPAAKKKAAAPAKKAAAPAKKAAAKPKKIETKTKKKEDKPKKAAAPSKKKAAE